MEKKGLKIILIVILLAMPFLLTAQIERFKMYEKKNEDSPNDSLVDSASSEGDLYKSGYTDGRLYAKSNGSNETNNIINSPLLEPDDLRKISKKKSASEYYQQGFEDGYYGKTISSDDSEKNDSYKNFATIVVSGIMIAYITLLFMPFLFQ
ncbi:MAG: hypothetical protein AB7T10_03365 [bacterium]